jgi:hypothetical protein
MAVATTAPTTLDERRVAYEPIAVPRATPRWGTPIWSADEPIAILERQPVGQVDLVVMSVILAHRPE